MISVWVWGPDPKLTADYFMKDVDGHQLMLKFIEA